MKLMDAATTRNAYYYNGLDQATIFRVREKFNFLRSLKQLYLGFAAANAKARHDAKHWRVDFNIGDAVYLRLRKGCTFPGKDLYNRRRPQAGRILVHGDDDERNSFEISQLIKRRVNKAGERPTLEYHESPGRL